MEGERRFSRREMHQKGRLLSVGWIVFSLCLEGVLYFMFHLSPFPDSPFSVVWCLAIIALFTMTQLRFKWLLWIHEGAHIGYACSHGVPCEHIGYIAKTGQRGVGASLTFFNTPKKVWGRLTLAPLTLPLVLIMLAPFCLLLGVVGIMLMAYSANDFFYAGKVLATPGRFVTTTEDEIIVSFHPLPE